MSQVQALSGTKIPVQNTPAQPAAGTQHTAEKVSSETTKLSVNQAVTNINEAVKSLRKDANFSVDEELDRVVVKIVNADTRELIKQIPSEDALELSKKMQEMVGLLFG